MLHFQKCHIPSPEMLHFRSKNISSLEVPYFISRNTLASSSKTLHLQKHYTLSLERFHSQKCCLYSVQNPERPHPYSKKTAFSYIQKGSHFIFTHAPVHLQKCPLSRNAFHLISRNVLPLISRNISFLETFQAANAHGISTKVSPNWPRCYRNSDTTSPLGSPGVSCIMSRAFPLFSCPCGPLGPLDHLLALSLSQEQRQSQELGCQGPGWGSPKGRDSG